MENEMVQFERRLYKNGASIAITLPSQLLKFLDIADEDIVVMVGQSSKKGKYIAFWKKDKEEVKNED